MAFIQTKSDQGGEYEDEHCSDCPVDPIDARHRASLAYGKVRWWAGQSSWCHSGLRC